jgi:hypothetical protein
MLAASTHAAALIAQEMVSSDHVPCGDGAARIAGIQTSAVKMVSIAASIAAARRGRIPSRMPSARVNQAWGTHSYLDASAITIPLPTSDIWLPLRADGTLGAPVTSVSLRNVEAMVLIKKSRIQPRRRFRQSDSHLQ